MLRSVIATALAVCVSAAIGCSKKSVETAAPSNSAAGTATQATSTVPVDASHAKIDTAIPLPQPFYESAEVGSSVKADGTIDAKMDNFESTNHLFISVKAREVPTGLAANLTIRDPEKKSVVDTRAVFDPATTRALFEVKDLSKWKPGLYDIEVVMEGDVVFKHGITIIGKRGATGTKSKAR